MTELAAALPTRRFTVDEVLAMVRSGILAEDEPVELIDGELITVSPQGSRHRYALLLLAEALRAAYGSRAIVASQVPLDAGPTSYPEPDLLLLRPPADRYRERVTGADALLAVEVALTSQTLDHRKARVYAAAGVPVYWLLDLAARRLVVHSEPRDGEYRLVRIYGEEERVGLPEVEGGVLVGEVVG